MYRPVAFSTKESWSKKVMIDLKNGPIRKYDPA